MSRVPLSTIQLLGALGYLLWGQMWVMIPRLVGCRVSVWRQLEHGRWSIFILSCGIVVLFYVLGLVVSSPVCVIFELAQLKLIRRSLMTLSILCEVHSQAAWSGVSTVVTRAHVIILYNIKVSPYQTRTLALFWRIRAISLMGTCIWLRVRLCQRLGTTQIVVFTSEHLLRNHPIL